MSELPKPTPSDQPSPETPEQPPVNNPAAPEQKKRWTIDQSLLATVSLSIISLCALIVSIYQTRVLSSQQEVMAGQQRIMAEQQRIMTESAKAQLWPNVEISRYRANKQDSIYQLGFTVANTGTGPAIIEGITIKYQGKYAKSWKSLFKLINLPDTISSTVDNQLLSGRVVQAGEQTTFLDVSSYPPLMNYLARILFQEENPPEITVCYKSVFNDYWLLTTELGGSEYARSLSEDSCVIADSIAFRD